MDNAQKEILEQAADLFYKYGIRSVTMDDISRQLGISKKTLYQYVENKEDLVSQTAEYVMSCTGQILEDLRNRKLSALDELTYVHDFAIQGIKDANPNVEFDLQKYYPKVYKRIETIKHERMYNFLVENMEKGINEDVYRENLDPDIIARLFIARTDAFLRDEIFSIEEMSKASFLDQIFSYHIHALCNMKGLAYYEQKIKNKNEKE